MVGSAIFAVAFFAILALIWALGSFVGRAEYTRQDSSAKSSPSSDSGTQHHG